MPRFVHYKFRSTGRLSGWSLCLLSCLCVLSAAFITTDTRAADKPAARKPATIAEAARVIDLAKFPLIEGAKEPGHRAVAGLSYVAASEVKKAFEFHKKKLTGLKWKELPNSYVTDESASGGFTKDGFVIFISVIPSGMPGLANVIIDNLANLELDKLPVPAGAKSFYAGPTMTSFLTEVPVEKTAAACRKLLLAQGWQPYGTAGDSAFYKQNAVRLHASISSAPAQGGKTMISYSAVLMSYDLPAPAETEGLQYSDQTAQLMFDSQEKPEEIASFYRTALEKVGWKATLDKIVEIDRKNTVIFRNSQKDMLTLQMYKVDDKTRTILKHQTAAELAEIEKRIEANIAKKKAEKDKPRAKVAVTLPAAAKEIKQTKTRIEFSVASGKARGIVEGFQKQFKKDGWEEKVATLEDLAGTVSLTKGDQDISLIYIDTGIMPAEITISLIGADLEQAKAKPE